MKRFWELEATMRRVGYVPEYARVAGSVAGGVLLSQLAYWFKPSKSGKTKLTINRGGLAWLAKSRQELLDETGLTEWQYRSAMTTLNHLGLVQQEVHLFQGKTRTHIHLETGRLAQLVLEVMASEAVRREPPNQNGGNLQTGFEDSSKPSGTESTAENTAESCADAPTPGEEEDRTAGEVKEGKLLHVDFKRGQDMASLDEILKARQDKAVDVTGPKSLGILWKKTVARNFDGFVKELTGKEIGQLKLVLAKVPNAAEVLVWTVHNWGTFTFEAKGRKGLTAVPERPVVGFLLEHHDVALQLIAQDQAVMDQPKVPKAELSKPVEKTQPVVQTPAKEVTAQDVKAALAKLKANGG